MQRVLYQQQTALHLQPANAEAIAELVKETGAEVMRGALRYPSESGGWQLGDIDLSEYLAKYRKYSLVTAIASWPRTRDWVLSLAPIYATIEL